MMMEIERLKSLKVEEERTFAREQARLEGKRMLVAQIQERNNERTRQMEMKEREQELMRQQVEKMRLTDQAAIQKKLERAIETKRQTELSNKRALEMKAMKVIKEKEDDDAIVRYNRERDQKEAERQAEE